MKINPPKATIDERKPFEDALFGREAFAKSLTNLLRNSEESLVIFVNAPWGAGKTTFSEMWRNYLHQQELEVIYFDAYAADYFDDPFVCFSGEILGLVDKRLPRGKRLIERREFKRTAVQVGKRLAGLAVKVGVRAATMGAVESAHLTELKEISSEIAAGVSKIGADVIEKKIEHYAGEKDALKSFKKSLAKLAAKVKDDQGFPLTIIVDELDRCRPDFALRLLDRIKHLFDVDGVAFVLLVNREQIESYIQTVYGNEDARDYLLKFGSLFIDLPSQQSPYAYQYEKGRREYCHQLFAHYGLSNRVGEGRFLVTCVEILSDHFELTLREIEKVFAILAIFYSSSTEDQSHGEMLTALLSVLKVKHPSLYRSLNKGNISADQFFQDSSLNQLRVSSGQGFNWERQKDVLDFYLMSDAELEEATSDEGGTKKVRGGLVQLKNNWRGNRRSFIPMLCSQLDRFSLRPQ